MAVLKMSKMIVILTQILMTIHLQLLKMTKAVVVIKETKLKTEGKAKDDKDQICSSPAVAERWVEGKSIHFAIHLAFSHPPRLRSRFEQKIVCL